MSYSRDVPKIKAYVEETGPDGLVHVGAFVVSTIQTPLVRTKLQVADIKKHGENSKALWGHKRLSYGHLWVYRRELYQMLVEAPVARSEALLRLVQVPGLGVVKGAFLLQCLGYETSCLDSHNVKRYGIDPKVLKVGNVKPATLTKKVEDYLSLCDNIGTSEHFWDSWCLYVAERGGMNKSLATADAVSAYHYEAITC
jgi:hypothetical protein